MDPLNTLFDDEDGKSIRFVKAPTVERCLVGGRILVQRLDAELAVSLSGSAPLIWELLDTHSTVSELIIELQQRFTDDEATIEAGVRNALESFADQGLAEPSGQFT